MLLSDEMPLELIITSTENKLLFKGFENPVTYERFYNLKLECDYDLQFYPFDSQRCLIKIEPRDDLLNLSCCIRTSSCTMAPYY